MSYSGQELIVSRIYSFDAILNFRDSGDYPARNGGCIRAGRLFRSADSHCADGRDTEISRLLRNRECW
ncbi:MAG: tyrosine-protein phosphatase [Hyphomonadaceae bacterium]|nr:tyrosine-protein phosphatase [Hyphomonadaceae bacterium]MBC6412308.1 tyrosine-protein phosphatase [Hyphomonadaceae bacterium]